MPAEHRTESLAITSCQALSAAYDARVSRWTDFREHIAARARQMFSHHLTSRGFTGKLKFQHEKCTLDILIQTEADAGKVKARQKDTKSLSGGEKSFSTVCLLLTMWESVGCPLRCLDEFVRTLEFASRRLELTSQPFLSLRMSSWCARCPVASSSTRA